MYKKWLIIFIYISFSYSLVPANRVVAEWEPALGVMIRWPLGIPSDLVVELATDDILYVLVETYNQQNQAVNTFNNLGINNEHIIFIDTDTYSHWTRDHGPQFLISDEEFKVIDQRFNGYPEENGCEFECDENMLLIDCIGNEFCNNQPQYAEEGYDCYVNNDLCIDFNGDGKIKDWIGDGYCDDGSWGLDFLCDEYSWDCGDCGGEVIDENGYCGEKHIKSNRHEYEGRPLVELNRGWEEDDGTNADFASQMNWDVLDLPLYWTGGNFMTDGYGAGFSTKLMVNENNINLNEFKQIMYEQLYFSDYYIFDNPNYESIQHIDCLAKLVGPETIIIKQVPESSPEYDCIEDFADSFYEINTFYGRPYKIHRILCPEINGGSWEVNPVAAYTNSLILNNKVLIPLYGIPEDDEALEVYRNAMPGYNVIGFHDTFNNSWYAEDALHCRTIGIFDPDMLHISHMKIRSEDIQYNDSIKVDVEIVGYGSSNMDLQSVTLKWKYSSEDGPFSEVLLENEFINEYSATFPALNANSSIEYYIQAIMENGVTGSHPNAGWHTFNTLEFFLGDINSDYLLNIQDVVLIINLVLVSEYNNLADLNSDLVIDILDVILLVNLIVEN